MISKMKSVTVCSVFFYFERRLVVGGNVTQPLHTTKVRIATTFMFTPVTVGNKNAWIKRAERKEMWHYY